MRIANCGLALCCSLSIVAHAETPTTAASAAAAPTSSTSPGIAIRAGKFIDVLAGRTLSNQIILIRGDKIVAVSADVAIPEGTQVIDLSGMTVLPGLIDCHTHLADSHDPEPLHVIQYSAVETA